MTRRRPTVVLVIAILNLIFGGLGLTCGVCGSVSEWTGLRDRMQDTRKQDRNAFQQRIVEESRKAKEALPADKIVSTGYQISGWVCGILLIASGIGLLQMAPWARWVAVGYAILSLSVTVANLLYDTLVRSPAVMAVLEKMQAGDSQEQTLLTVAKTTGRFAPLIGCVLLIYPIVVLSVMFLPNVRAAFRVPPDVWDEEEPPLRRERDARPDPFP